MSLGFSLCLREVSGGVLDCAWCDISPLTLVYMIRLGTLEQEATADVEWRWHPYTNTARKRVFLSAE